MALKDTLNPVRLYTDEDAYHYTIDNRPLEDLRSNDEALADEIDKKASLSGANFAGKVEVVSSNSTAYVSNSTDGQLTAGATLAIRATAGANTNVAQLVFQSRASQPYNRIVSSGGSAPFMAFVINNTEALRIGSTGKLGNVNIGAGSNVVTDYPIRIDNSSNNYAAGYGAYGLSNRVNAANLNIDYTVDIGRNFIVKTADTESFRVSSLGNVSVGPTTAGATINLRVDKNITGGVSAYGVYNIGVVQSDVTTQAAMFRTLPSTVAAAFTLNHLQHYYATQSTIGADSIVNNQYGFSAESSLIGATNNYGFYGNIPSGTGRWNLYMAGTALNYLAGDLLVGKTSITDNGGDIQLSKGMSFPATQVACSDPNTLDDYEEGTFTTTIVGTTTAGAGTYSQQAGRYTKIGNRVFFTAKLSWTAHTGTGDMRIGGLPFTSNSTSTNESAVSLRINNITLTASSIMQGYIGANSTQIILDQYPVGGGAATAVALDTSATMIVTGHYDI